MSLHQLSGFLLLLIITSSICQGCEVKRSGFSKKTSFSDPLGPTPCDNYGDISPLMHTMHKNLFRSCASSCKIDSNLPESVKKSLHKANKVRYLKACALREKLSAKILLFS